MNLLEKKVFLYKNHKLAYYEGGNGRPLLFVQGVGISALTYKKSLELLAKKYHVLAPDLFGFGGSDAPQADWTFADYIVALKKFLSEKKIDNVVVVGHSLGGRIAFSLAVCDSSVKLLILVDSSPLAEYYKNKKNRLISLITHTTQEMLISRHPAFFIIMWDVIKNVLKHHIKYIHIRKIVNTSLQINDRETEKILIPTLILWGDKDLVINSSEAYILHDEIPNSTVKIVKGNHSWPLTNPDLFYTEVDSFISNPHNS